MKQLNILLELGIVDIIHSAVDHIVTAIYPVDLKTFHLKPQTSFFGGREEKWKSQGQHSKLDFILWRPRMSALGNGRHEHFISRLSWPK